MTHPKWIAAEEALKNGDAKPLVALGMKCALSGFQGLRCKCETPELYGLDIMCRECLLENEGQRQKRVEAHRSPHEFVPKENSTRLDVGMCGFCSGWRNDPRHGEPVEENLSDKAQQVREIVDAVFAKRDAEFER